MLPNRDDRHFSTINYLRNYAQQFINARKELPRDKDELIERSVGFKRILLECLGGMPEEKCDLNPLIAQESDIEDCLLEEVYFDSELGVTVPALVSKPKDRKGRKPAIIVVPGWPQTKECFPKFRTMMAKEGYIVICIDTRSHGERRIVADTFNDTYNAVGFGILLGKPFLGMAAWDIIRTVDYLETRDDVNEERIGIIGLCYGGMQTWLSGALDERLKVVVPVCGTSTYEAMINEISSYHTHCLLTYIPNLIRYGDIQDIIALIAPRPLLIVNNSNDWWFPVSGLKKVGREIEGVYETLGAKDKFDHILRSTVHDITPEFGEKAKKWFDKWL